MKITNLFKILLLVSTIIIIIGCTEKITDQTNGKDNSIDNNVIDKQVSSFKECIDAGNPAMESYPRQCRHGDKTYTEEIQEVGTGKPVPCTKEYVPVCGEVDVQCIKAPCPPVEKTFGNKCVAEASGAKNIYEGECKEAGIDPKSTCLSFDGIWIEESNECEGMARMQCEELGGVANECASACRNKPETQICTMQCVLVCDFSNLKITK
jgi:hypothetical protein